MSKMKELDGMLSELVMELVKDIMVTYEAAADVDVILVYFPKDMEVEGKSSDGEYMPAAVVPNSERAKALFMGWGMADKCMGIKPPEDAMDLIVSLPMDFKLVKQEIKEGAHIIHEIALPRALPVVH